MMSASNRNDHSVSHMEEMEEGEAFDHEPLLNNNTTGTSAVRMRSRSHHEISPPPVQYFPSSSNAHVLWNYILTNAKQQFSLRPYRLTAVLIILFLYILLPLWSLYLRLHDRCDMAPRLLPLLLFTTRAFNAASIEYWLDYGTLLGAMRTNSIIPWEFDLDLSSHMDECDKIDELADVFRTHGYLFYKRADWVPEKASFMHGYTGYLVKPCVRIIDPNTKIYIDVDWHLTIPGDDMPDAPALSDPKSSLATKTPYGTFYMPPGYVRADGDLLCNEEGFSGSDPGGCRRFNDIYPLKQTIMYDVPMRVPGNSERVLRDLYGEDWRVPHPKGYKVVVCGWLPTTFSLVMLCFVLYVIVPLSIYLRYRSSLRLSTR